jgi:tetratricopeptide (TPR) repeat protein
MARRTGRQTRRQAAAALDRAQQLIYDAWEAGTAKKRIELARKALEISQHCADAYVLLAEHAKSGSDAELDLWRQGVSAGEAALGKEGFEEFAGRFWGFLETRPYMRARFGLAMALWRRGVRDEAVEHLRGMLRLNPNDNQGIRYVLAASLVELDLDDELAALLDAYPDDGAAAWRFTEALLAFRRGGDHERSRRLLANAIGANKFVPGYLLGTRKMPARLPAFMGIGDNDEAIHFASEFAAGWTGTPGALDWLRRNAGR